MQTIILTPQEVWLAEKFGQARRRCNVKNGTVNQQRAATDAETLDIHGYMAELGFAKASNSYPDFTISPRQGGVDLTVNGVRIDVKQTTHANGHLIVKPGYNADVDALVLMIGPTFHEEDGKPTCTMTYAGWVFVDDLVKYPSKLPRCDAEYAVPQCKLRSGLPTPRAVFEDLVT